MLLAEVLQMSGVYVSRSAVPLQAVRAIAYVPQDCSARRECCLLDAPRRRSIDNSASCTDNASSSCLQRINRSQAAFIAIPEGSVLRPPQIRLPARPPERALHDAVVFLLAQSYTCSTAPTSHQTPCSSKLFSSASATKIFACSAKHDTCAKPAVPRHAHPRTRPSFVFQCKACVQM